MPRRWTLFVLACAVCLTADPVNAISSGGRLRRTLVHGKVTAVESAELIGGVRIEIKGGPGGAVTGSSNTRGRYRIRLPMGAEGPLPVVIRTDGRWTRRSWVQIEPGARRVRADWSLIPKGSGDFGMGLFDAITRSGDVGTTRWETPPKFRVLNRRLACLDSLVSEKCSEWVATTSPVPMTHEARLNAVANAAALTGDPTAETEIEIVTLAAGTRLTRADLLQPGVFTIGEAMVGQSGAKLPDLMPGEVIRTRLILTEASAGDPWFLARIVAEGLGYTGSYQPSGLCERALALGARSMFCQMHGTIQATEFDAVMGAVLYGRRVGTSSPDSEPPPAEAEGG